MDSIQKKPKKAPACNPCKASPSRSVPPSARRHTVSSLCREEDSMHNHTRPPAEDRANTLLDLPCRSHGHTSFLAQYYPLDQNLEPLLIAQICPPNSLRIVLKVRRGGLSALTLTTCLELRSDPRFTHPLISKTSIRSDIRSVSFQLHLLPPQSRVLALCIVAYGSLWSFHTSVLGNGPHPESFLDHAFFASRQELLHCGVRRAPAYRALRAQAQKAAWEIGAILVPSNENAASCYLLDLMNQNDLCSSSTRPWATAYFAHIRVLAPSWWALSQTPFGFSGFPRWTGAPYVGMSRVGENSDAINGTSRALDPYPKPTSSASSTLSQRCIPSSRYCSPTSPRPPPIPGSAAYVLTLAFSGLVLPFYRELQYRENHSMDDTPQKKRFRLLCEQAHDVAVLGGREFARGIRHLPKIHYFPFHCATVLAWAEFVVEQADARGDTPLSLQAARDLKTYANELKLLGYSLDIASSTQASALIERLDRHADRALVALFYPTDSA
ncbi:Zn(2)-C6 fungal-type domain-containing protein [Mycena sanguinolenta]|uniref:Zn(2)-C6 fungal-type domain-containing protein n=1 Tax=Mycena sanguinolenta TaxID=230812 RepID=A0A8H7CR99_9AGAR|nr:Zn(2)-C6 fungal-type domain-containing protein [Mycena sanguinolenta]